MQEEGFMINNVGQAVESAFAPFRKELEDDSESEQMKENVKEAEKILKKNAEDGPPPNPFSADDIEKKLVLLSVCVCVWFITDINVS